MTHRMTRGVHPQARVGGPPEDRDWIKSGTPAYPPAIHDTAWINAFATIDAGTKRPTYIGADVIVLAHAHVGHDARVHQAADIATGAIIGGHAVIGAGAKIGLGAIILPFRRVGAAAVIGAGSVVTRDIPPGETWCGNPARRITRNPVPFTEREAA